MAFVYREDKLKNIRPNTALGPGEYLPQSKSKILKNNDGRAPFESGVKKFKPLYGELNAIRNITPGPGKYYVDDLKAKTKKMENLANIKLSNYEDLENNSNFKIKAKLNLIQPKEKLGFDVKEQRFKNPDNINPGPGEYFQKKKNKGNKGRARSALFLNNDYAPKSAKVIVPSIPYRDNGFEIGENNSLIKLENPDEVEKKNKGKIGPGSYDIDNPQSWLKNGTSWSKMKVEREMNISNQASSKDITRPESALELNINVVPLQNPEMVKNKFNKSKKRTKTAYHIPVYYKMMKESAEERKQNNIKMLIDKKAYQVPGPGYYLDIQKNSTFYRDSLPFPEFKQFFLSNNERFPELKQNEFLGPATYFQNNNYFNSTFSSGKIQKSTDKNKKMKTPFSSREKRFNQIQGNNEIEIGKTPGPGSYDPKIIKSIVTNKFNNATNTFNFRSKRFGTTGSDIKWKQSTPGPGSYINPYTATGTSNTLLVNGLYIDIRKGKEILRPRAKETKPLNNNIKKINKGNNVPGVGLYNPDMITSISYNNRKKVKENSNINVAFSSRIPNEENKKESKSNIGPGMYYKDKPIKQTQISPPFHDSDVKFKSNKKMFGIGPGYYESRSYFDWNKKSFNSTFY